MKKQIEGWTEITIHPTDPMLRQVRLNSRQCKIKKYTINGKTVSQSKYEEPYASFKIHDTATIHQHHMFQRKIQGVLHDPPEHELIITLPSKFRIEPADPFNSQFGGVTGRNPSSSRATPDVGAPATPALMTARTDSGMPYVPFQLRIEFVLDNIRDGFMFVGCESGDERYPHAYTTSSPLPGAACCLFPTLDGIHERWTWDLEITVPKIVGDIGRTAVKPPESDTTMVNGVDSLEETEENDEEDDELELMVVCSADYVDEENHPTQPWKKIVKFTQSQPVAPQHISLAVGPFEKINLGEFRDVENEETMGTMSVDVFGYCLPGREAELKNTCMFLPKAIDFLVKEFGQYVFAQFKVCFVDDLPTDTVESASLALCSNRLLFPDTIIDPLWPVTKAITYALTAQWSGIQVVPKDWADIWVIVGIAYWMTGCFMRSLTGNNEYRYRLKKDAERICELDIGRPSLYAQGFQVPIEPAQLDFIKLKAPVVLTILEKRLWKLSSSMVLHRVVRKTFLSAVAGDLKNGLMSTAHFIRLCEKNSHNKLEQFFSQWVYGAGYPMFQVSQRFNKKRMIVEMGIRQVQAQQAAQKTVTSDEFLKDALNQSRHIVPGAVQPVFTGPMTIRIHEADGTPYEHVVDLKEGFMKLDIPYNTKYKRLKRSRRQKERAAAGAGVDVSLEQQNDDVLLYCLGDVLQGEEEVDEWRLVDWSKEDEEKMAQESFEWIRMDADFEWICTLQINQPDYMFLSQLQQDRDVIAQYDSIRHFATIRESALVSSILVRTLMDRRYYYRIRVEAAMALARCATADLQWKGQFHLMKAFQEFFCFPGSNIPRSNDFSDLTAYYVQNAIPQAMSQIRNISGVCPVNVQRWILDLLRYNDNSNNSFDDCYYVANLMTALANTLIASQKKLLHNEYDMNLDFEDPEEASAEEDAIKEIERYQRMDQWQPTYRNIISETALDIRRRFALAGVQKLDLRIFMPYVREGTLDTLRVKAFDCLVELGAFKHPVLLKLICKVMGSDPSPYVRRMVQGVFGRGLGMIALEKKPANRDEGMEMSGLMVLDDTNADGTDARRDALKQGTIQGSMAALKSELADNQVMKEALWDAIKSPELGIIELRFLLDICPLLYDSRDSWIVIMRRPKHLTCTHLGKGVVKFKWAYRDITPQPTAPGPAPLKNAGPPATSQPRHSTSSGSLATANRPNQIRINFKTPKPSSASPPTPSSTPGTPNGVHTATPPTKKKKSSVSRTPSFTGTPSSASMAPPPTPTGTNPMVPPRKIILKIGKNHLQTQQVAVSPGGHHQSPPPQQARHNGAR
ncbi:hypothetical protein EX30DRAFT_88447 [Ascodesmis nigricans]|uniref:Transcription initiation factor TFIID subunit 2 n=1 Tax=Ascodesmis nigricans TaxID=341454 RepID=A0A4S2N3G1_9PEZI|nr:hypothetical protein EX30DRAFT_88447 [Ascodesmis nigricans]